MISSRGGGGGGGGDGDGSSNTANGRNNTNYNYNNTPTSKQEVGDKFQLLAGKIWPPFKSMEAAPSSAGARANKPRERERADSGCCRPESFGRNTIIIYLMSVALFNPWAARSSGRPLSLNWPPKVQLSGAEGGAPEAGWDKDGSDSTRKPANGY